MIRVVVNNYGFHVYGHAGYAPEGQDIICAGVSALTFGTIHGMETYAGMSLTVDQKAKGDIDVTWDELTHEGKVLLQTYMDAIGIIKTGYGHILTEDKRRFDSV